MPQSLAAIYLHLVFSTKHRKPFLQDPDLRDAVHGYLGGATKQLGCPPIRIGGTEDHVHVLARFGRTITPADWIKELKRVSTIWIHDRYPSQQDFYWQSGYGIFSVSQSNLPEVTSYVEKQEEHHRHMTFKDEFRALCARHGIEIDERYVWE